MNPLRWSFRPAYLAGFGICAALMGFALYAEYAMGLTPCKLCVFQRIGFVWMGLMFLAGGLHAPRRGGQWIYAALVVIGAVWGIVMAARQLWLQSLPAEMVPTCGPPLAYLFENFGWLDTLKVVFAGSGDCATVHWRFLGLSMPGWTLIWYVLLGAWALWSARSRRLRPPLAARIA
jgi:disulfide bond formation protein DsbB